MEVVQLYTPSLILPDQRLCRIPFMVREPHHERDCLIVNSSIYSFALSLSKGSERIVTQSLKGKEIRWKPSPMLSVVQVSYDCDNMVSVRIRCKDFFRLVICLLTFAFLLPFSVHSAEL